MYFGKIHSLLFDHDPSFLQQVGSERKSGFNGTNQAEEKGFPINCHRLKAEKINLNQMIRLVNLEQHSKDTHCLIQD